MPVTTFKRKGPLVKTVRRNATTHLDAVIKALTGTADDRLAVAERELQRLMALLELVRRPLGGQVFQRERRVLLRAFKALPDSAEERKMAPLRALAAADPPVDVDEVLPQITPDPAPKPTAKKAGPDPKLLRLLADLAEMRMRARYWHLPAGEFGLLAPGLRASYTLARKHAAGPPTAAAVEAWRTLADQMQSLERAWLPVLTPLRKELRSAEKQARLGAAVHDLKSALGDHATLGPRLDAELSGIDKTAPAQHARLLAETPAAFVKRMQAYWDAWRGIGD